MKTYEISKNGNETITFKVDDERYTLVNSWVGIAGRDYKLIIMNKREILNLYRAIQSEILKDSSRGIT